MCHEPHTRYLHKDLGCLIHLPQIACRASWRCGRGWMSVSWKRMIDIAGAALGSSLSSPTCYKDLGSWEAVQPPEARRNHLPHLVGSEQRDALQKEES